MRKVPLELPQFFPAAASNETIVTEMEVPKKGNAGSPVESDHGRVPTE